MFNAVDVLRMRAARRQLLAKVGQWPFVDGDLREIACFECAADQAKQSVEVYVKQIRIERQ